MWDLWNIVCDAIDHLGDPTSNLEQLVQMMICISKLPDVVDVNGEVVKPSMNSKVFWRELPGFAFYFREVAVSKSREGEKNPIVPFLSLPSEVYTCFPYFPFLFFFFLPN